MYGDLKILTGTANPQLALDICDHLGCCLTPSLCETFSDGEIRIEIGASVRGHDVFVIQPTCAPANYNFMQLCLMLDALKRASAGGITAVIPYYGYARQDRKVSPRAPISAKVTADFLSMAGAQRIVTMDLHAGQIQGFFNMFHPNTTCAVQHEPRSFQRATNAQNRHATSTGNPHFHSGILP